MKLETQVSDLTAYLATLTAKANTTRAKNRPILDASDLAEAQKNVALFFDARATESATIERFKKIPLARRNSAESAHEFGQALANQVFVTAPQYSGNTLKHAQWGEETCARTTTDDGARYSRRCSYRMTDACHSITLCADDVLRLKNSVESELLALSRMDGLPLLGQKDNGALIWVERKGKKLVSETGWIAYSKAESLLFHSETSQEDADKGLVKKVNALLRERALAQKARIESHKLQRRAHLLGKLANICATVEDAKALGFCDPGIRAFQSRWGIGDSAPLSALLKTGDPSAIRLALAIASKIKKSA